MNRHLGGVLFALPLLFLICLPCYASGSLFAHGPDDELSSYVVQNGNETVTGITTNHRILGYTVTGTANAVVGLYNAGILSAEDGCLANDSKTVWLPFPIEITGNFVVQVNASTTIVTIFYEKGNN